MVIRYACLVFGCILFTNLSKRVCLHVIGIDMFPDDSVAKHERKDYNDWNSEDTYSMSFHGMYTDWLKWEFVNIPGIYVRKHILIGTALIYTAVIIVLSLVKYHVVGCISHNPAAILRENTYIYI